MFIKVLTVESYLGMLHKINNGPVEVLTGRSIQEHLSCFRMYESVWKFSHDLKNMWNIKCDTIEAWEEYEKLNPDFLKIEYDNNTRDLDHMILYFNPWRNKSKIMFTALELLTYNMGFTSEDIKIFNYTKIKPS